MTVLTYLNKVTGEVIDICGSYGTIAIQTNQKICMVLFDICDINSDKKVEQLSELYKIGDKLVFDAVLGVEKSEFNEQEICYFATKVWGKACQKCPVPTGKRNLPSLLKKNVKKEKIECFNVARLTMEKRIVFDIMRKKFNKTKEVSRGQTTCQVCGLQYGNFKRPHVCACGNNFGSGIDPKKEKSSNEAVKINDNIFSIRVHPKGHSKRSFVNISTRTCFVSECYENKPVQTSPCVHIEKCEQSSLNAKEIIVKSDKDILLSHGFSKEQSETIYEKDKGLTRIFLLKGISGPPVAVVNSYKDPSHDAPVQMIHVVDGTCELVSCKKQNSHSRIEKRQICLHNMLVDFAGQQKKEEKEKERDRLIDQTKTVEKVLSDLKENFPSIHQKDQIEKFILNTNSPPDDISQYCASSCEECGKSLIPWKYSRPCFLVEFNKISSIKTVTRFCPQCHLIYYPKVASLGLITIHNRCVVNFEFLMDIYDQMILGSPLCKYISQKLSRFLSKASGSLKVESLNNLSREIQAMSVASLSVMTTGQSLDEVLCIICGIFPIVVESDGNSANVVKIDKNTMVFKKTSDPLYTLEDLKKILLKDVTKCAFFQHPEREQININQLPPIMAPKVTGEIVNSESAKNSQFDDDVLIFKDVNLNEFVKILEQGNYDITEMNKCTLNQLKTLADSCKISYPPNCSKAMLIEKCKAVERFILAGGSNTHVYYCRQKFTGGWQDLWCRHGVKYGAKVQGRQESCVDAVDLTRSLVKRPPFHVCDDACGVTNNEMLRYPEESAKTLGVKRRGCFSDVNPRKRPKRGETCDRDGTCCEDLTVIEKVDHTDVVPGPLYHPDTRSSRRYRFGHNLGVKKTKIPNKKSKVSHKRINCSYHDIKLCRKGNFIKTMIQEAQQVRRKTRRTKPDRSHTFSLSFLFNIVLDFAENDEKLARKIKSIKKNCKTKFIGRHKVTWRGVFRKD